MAMRDRIHQITDREMTWTGAIILGTFVWVLAIILLGQIPSVIIYKADQYIAEIIEFTQKIPGVNEEGLNTKQVKIIRDMIANGVQITFLVMMLAAAYIYQERKRKRTGTKGLPDPVRGYMPGK
jgi:hypothetical protein